MTFTLLMSRRGESCEKRRNSTQILMKGFLQWIPWIEGREPNVEVRVVRNFEQIGRLTVSCLPMDHCSESTGTANDSYSNDAFQRV